MPHTSYLIPHTSYLIPHTSYLIPHTSYFILHTSYLKMSVLLTHGYFLHEDPKEQVIMKPYPPLGILYIAAWLDRHGIENTVFDTTFSTFEALQEAISVQRPAVVALYTNLMTKLNVIRIMRWIRSLPELDRKSVV